MTDKPRDLTLKRVNRLSTAVADLMESQTSHNGMVLGILKRLDDRLDAIDAKFGAVSRDIRGLASEQVLLGNRVESAFTRALRTNIRLDEIEDERGHAEG
jgi:hypothetical protein